MFGFRMSNNIAERFGSVRFRQHYTVMRLPTKSFPPSSASLGNFTFVSIVIFGIERITLGRIGGITVFPVKRPQVWARV